VSASLALRTYVEVLWRRKWMILVLVVVATGAAFYYSYRQPKQYSANADLIYERPVDLSNPLTGQGYVDSSERYAQLASVGSVLASPDMVQRASTELRSSGAPVSGFSVSSAPLVDSASANAEFTSMVVRITAVSGDPQLAAKAANIYAVTYVVYRKETVKAQIQSAVDAVNSKMATYEGAAKKSTDYLVLQQRLQDLQLLRTTATGNFRVLVPATVPTAPFAPQPVKNALLGLVAGLIVAVALAFFVDLFDTRIRGVDEIAGVLRQPLLGRIPRISGKVFTEGAVVALRQPDGNVAEAFRLVRTNLEFMAVDAELHSLLVTSCVQGEGKSVAVANLAVTLAMSGKKVVVVDADLRRPRQHTYFALNNEKGVSTVATGKNKLVDALQPVGVAYHENAPAIRDFAAWAKREDAGSRLYVLPSGPVPPNPGEIVASQSLSRIIDELVGSADLVLVDSPALLPVGDTSAIAPKVDGLVFLVDMRVVKRPQLMAAAEQLSRLPVRNLGAIVRVDRAGERYQSYSYGRGYSYSESGSSRRRKGRGNGASPSEKESSGASARV
jgi:Mrp family chromosome partitioning ATPase/uncharacterized protein involved in exopolysaccharide biosynthesis